jgi:hypothetical protein
MPRSLPGRVEVLERAVTPRRERRPSDEELMGWFEELARDPKPDYPAAFLPAWERYPR